MSEQKDTKKPELTGKQKAIVMAVMAAFLLYMYQLSGLSKQPTETEVPTSNSNNVAQEVAPVFDLEALHGKNIEEIRSSLGAPTDGKLTNPTELQMSSGIDEWNNTFEKDGYELLVTYNPQDKSVIDFFVSSKEGTTKDVSKLKKIANVDASTKYSVEGVRSLTDGSTYTGIKVTTR